MSEMLFDGAFMPITNPKCNISLSVLGTQMICRAKSKFGKIKIEYVSISNFSLNSEYFDCPAVELLDLTQSAINDISQYTYLTYKSIKQGNENWYKYINDAWARERTEYLYKGKTLLVDNKIAELVSTTALCARPNLDKLVVINK